jgi:hypothetical protein
MCALSSSLSVNRRAHSGHSLTVAVAGVDSGGALAGSDGTFESARSSPLWFRETASCHPETATRAEPDGAGPCDSDDFDGRDGDGISIAGGAKVGR